MKGEGNQVAFEARIYDPRIGKFLSRDPLEKEYPYQSTYSFAANSPIRLIDALGMRPDDPINKLSYWMQFRYYAYKATEFVAEGRLTAWTETGRQNQAAIVNYTAPILLGTANGWIRSASLGTINMSAAQIGLSPDHEEGFNRSSYSAAAVPNPYTFGTSGPSAPSAALAGGVKLLVQKATDLELKLASIVFSSGINDAPQSSEGNQSTSEAEGDNFSLTRGGELTDGNYTVNKELMKKHVVGGVPGRSIFYPTLNADEAVLKAARYADANKLWNFNVGTKAKVPVFNTNIGTTGLGKPTNVINVYRKPNGVIHGSPGTPSN